MALCSAVAEAEYRMKVVQGVFIAAVGCRIVWCLYWNGGQCHATVRDTVSQEGGWLRADTVAEVGYRPGRRQYAKGQLRAD